ncbi:hypothetical protein [Acinetobacter stercoris]|uniref:Uncharacterized protein n=1 Tax=Acinetobacter stercoris TaxID=2126983 RepID=A0A2U3MZW5_9GAMM|nr:MULTISPECIES: hypothetical protein [Acinetobacter]SPL70913.1 hypothetical protein KPC_2091 [Acinetobacter stercoris]
MLIFKQKILNLKSQFHPEYFLNALIVLIIIFIIVLATFALARPIQVQQYQKVVDLSYQATYPETQQMAKQLLQQSVIHRVDYFRLMHARHFEKVHTKKYPALNINDYQR